MKIYTSEKEMLKAQYSDIVSDGGLDPRDKFAKREWADLTEWQIAKVLQQCQDEMTRPPSEEFAFKFARAIEAKLKEKNT